VKRLFGTDGVRGVAGAFPLDEATVSRLGLALGALLRTGMNGGEPRVLIGRDTRESGPEIEAWLSRGLRESGVRPDVLGIVTTPALAYLTRDGGYAAGAMISASHNPYTDNGIKVLGPDGMKFPDAREVMIERLILDGVTGTAGGRVSTAPPASSVERRKPSARVKNDPVPELFPEASPALEAYLRHLTEAAGGPGCLEGLSIVLDCAHGAASRIAPPLFASLGARVTAIGCEPTGRNINTGCGSLHLEPLQNEVPRIGADIGLAFDGDADRCLPVDRTGAALDGDFILWIEARRLHARGLLRGNAVVATVMSNLWLEHALAGEGIRLLRAPVGDKYVLERMLAENASLGGEQSGHIIFLDHFPTGDGILTGLLLASAVRQDGIDIAAVAAGIRRCPQVLLNVKVARRIPFADHPVIGPAIARLEGRLAGQGRLLLRYSGTEPLARVMVEGTDENLVHSVADELASLIQAELGA
jgi:phosphoglucosamine mutase